MKHRPKHVIEYVFLRTLTAAFRMLPYRAALFLGWINAWIGFHLVHFRVREAKRRIRLVLGDSIDDRDVRAIAWQSWRNLVFTAVETLRMDLMQKDVEHFMDGSEFFMTLKNQCKTGKGAIAAASHMGSWEVSGAYMRHVGVPIFTIVGKQRNPLVNDFLNLMRERAGVDAVPRHSTSLRRIIRGLNEGKLLGIMADVRMRTGGIVVPFLGGEANVGEGMASFARQCNVPIIPGVVKRHGWSRHEGISGAFIWPDPDRDKAEDIRRMTEEVLAFFDAAIREDPGQWFWYNKRWILDPVET